MSKIALTPSASGTGVFTIASPATNTDRTLVLPDITGTLVSTDASGNVGIGTSTPAADLDIKRTSGDSSDILRLGSTDNYYFGFARSNPTGALSIQGNQSGYNNIILAPTSGNVGIGTSSPSQKLHVEGAGNQFILLNNSTTNDGFYFKAGAGASSIQTNAGSHVMNFFTGGSERLRINSSGDVLVGTLNVDPSFGTTAGSSLQSSGQTHHSSTGTSLILNRTASDGTIAQFRKAGTTVGSIGVDNSDNLVIEGNSGHSGIQFGTNALLPHKNGAVADNLIDLGSITERFDDIYATNGTIQTSDRNEKQDIDVMSEAETRVAAACKGLIRKFRWIDAVAEKGDDARIHFGIIAQDLQDAFTAEGLDAGRYAMFISSTWWEADRVVPAVEAVEGAEATYDDEGNQLTEAVEAVVAVAEHTVTDTYDTLEEAPEGATERTRLGVRYPELLAFIIGAL